MNWPSWLATARRQWTLIGVVAVIVVVLFVLAILLGPHPPPYVKITAVDFAIVNSGSNSTVPWFPIPWINLTVGFPYYILSGGTFNVTIILFNTDSVAHYVTVSIDPPLGILHTRPPVSPIYVDPGDDDDITMTLQVNATAGSTITGMGEVFVVG